MESFGHKIFISSQLVPLTGTGVLYPRVRDFLLLSTNHKSFANLQFLSNTHTLKITNNYRLAISTIPLVIETTQMFVFKLFAAKFSIPTVPLLTEMSL